MSTENTEQPTPSQPNPFGPQDIVNTVMLLDEACEAGAFKGWEQIQKAFNIRNRLLQFAQSWQATTERLEAEAAAAAANEQEETSEG